MAKFKDLTNERFGRLVAVKCHGSNCYGRSLWEFECDCGNRKISMSGDVVSGKTKSCGCLKREMLQEKNFKHGKRHEPIYRIWLAMNERCRNKNAINYYSYGGRGITVCEEWKQFENFYRDMGDRPKGRSIDRIDNNGNYELSNCRWATRVEQANNKRRKGDPK